MRFRMIIGIFVITLLAFFKLAEASYFPFNDTGSSSNLGIGTTSAFGGKLIVMGGNVGVGSLTPGSVLDVQGTSRATGFQLSTNPASGYVLVSGSTGIGTWMAASTLATSGGGASGWSTGTGTIYPTTITDNIGIGTNTPQGSLVVTNGNVGIGTWAPIASLDIRNSGNTYGIYSTLNSGGSVGYAIYGYLSSGASGVGVYGEHGGTSGKAVYGYASQQGGGAAVGVYGASAGSSTGTGVYASQTHGSNVGYALAASNNSATGWTIYALGTSPNYFASNVGLGTIRPNAALSVVGNVGIGTGINSPFLVASPPSGGMIVEGNVGIGTTTPQAGLVVLGNVGLGTWTADTARLATDSFRLTTSPAAGYVLVSGSTGIGTWMAASTLATSGGSSQWTTTNTNDVYLPNNGNVGLGTTLTATSALSVMHGNVGIGTWKPTGPLDIINGPLKLRGSLASITFTSIAGQGTFFVTTTSSGFYETMLGVSGNTDVGIYQSNTQKIVIDYQNRIGIGHSTNTNVGIGTSAPAAKLSVMGGNVAIGTLRADGGMLIVYGGNVGIGTVLAPTTMALKGSLSQIVVTLTDAASVATDASLGNHFRLTTTQNFTLSNPTNPTDGQRVVWEIIQDGTGSRTITLDTKFALGTDITAVTLTTTASKRDFLTAIYNVTADKWYVVGFVKGY